MNHTRGALRTVQTVTDPVTGRIYPIPAGGSSNDAPPAGDDAGDDGGDGSGADEDDGDDGNEDDDAGRAGGAEALKADLAKERQKRKTERDARKALEAEVARLKGENESEVERAVREARESALAPAIRSVRRTAVETAATAFGFVDAADAVALVDLEAIDVDDEDLEVDRAQVAAAVEDLGKRKPHLLTDDARERLAGRSGSRRGGADTQSGNGSGGSAGSDPSGSFMNALRSKAGVRG